MIKYYELQALVNYEAEEGVFRWAVSRGFKKRGTKASTSRITIDGKGYEAGKLAWFYTYCQWPGKNFRYLNGDKTDIRLANLSDSKPGKVKPDRSLDYWVRMTREGDGYKLELTRRRATPVDLGTYDSYDLACDVQRRCLHVPD